MVILFSSIFNSLAKSINPEVGIPNAKTKMALAFYDLIKQAAISFKNIRKSDDIGFFYGNNKDTDKHSCRNQKLSKFENS